MLHIEFKHEEDRMKGHRMATGLIQSSVNLPAALQEIGS